jgi:CheY-like chemotaxis protein
MKVLAEKKFDAVIVDCDDMDGSTRVLKAIRQVPSNKSTIAFAIVNGITSVRDAFSMGANFVLDKPLSVERAARSLRAAHGLMVRERRRYFRQNVSAPVALAFGKVENCQAVITNLSEGGMALELKGQQIGPTWSTKFRFELPETKLPIEGRGEFAWADAQGHAGIRFLYIAPSMQENLERWLQTRLQSDETASAPIFINATKGIPTVGH